MKPDSFTQPADPAYVLMTAAHNEEAHMEQTIISVLAQTLRPQRWVIVSDGSMDRTDEIVKRYADAHNIIRFLRVNRAPGRSFRSKVIALQRGAKLLESAVYRYIGNLDADVTVEPRYFEELIHRFERAPRLGMLSGFVCEETAGEFHVRSSNRIESIPHAAQLLRRECYEAIGGYAVLRYGGEDWHAQTCAKMNGWQVQALPEFKIFHHRHTGEGDSLLKDRFRLGRLDYSFGSDPLFEIGKCLRRVPERPFLIGGLTRLAGFAWSSICREARPVSAKFMAFLRGEQRARVVALFQRAVARPQGSPRLKTNAIR